MNNKITTWFKINYKWLFFTMLSGILFVFVVKNHSMQIAADKSAPEHIPESILKSIANSEKHGYEFDKEPIAVLLKVGVFAKSLDRERMQESTIFYTLWCVDSRTHISIKKDFTANERGGFPTIENMSLVYPDRSC
jgi:hypothetical protein